MYRNRILSALLAAGCVLGLAVPAAAAEIDCDSTYCFSAEDFSGEMSLEGICITGLPEELGLLQLGNRILMEGDILTAEQLGQMTVTPLRSEFDRTVELTYLPICETFVGDSAVMTLSIRGREDKPPVAEDSAMETYKNLPNTAKLKVSDPEGQAMTFTVTRQPRRGTVEISSDGSFTYTPKKNKVGVDSFVYTAADPAGKISREATVTITILKPTDAAQYTDTLGRDCRFAAEWMRHSGIFVGESLGQTACFGPDKEVTRGEFVAMLVKALDIPEEEELACTGYTDEIPVWLQPYLAAAIRSGLTAGLPDQKVFGADEPITGAEVAVMLRNALDLSAQESFAQDEDTPITRSQAANILYQTVKAAQEQKIDQLV
ncbi:MAG: S-layer homology domain-containing protein [Oscillospiraceae bacterium]|nr:S-layer homology domain-containing protein [Oscillospiraceae bacterium]MBQ7129766.1 S-layer homology domain-containing protein [Oscillospiraceae bacterium]